MTTILCNCQLIVLLFTQIDHHTDVLLCYGLLRFKPCLYSCRDLSNSLDGFRLKIKLTFVDSNIQAALAVGKALILLSVIFSHYICTLEKS